MKDEGGRMRMKVEDGRMMMKLKTNEGINNER
jgi:hypothetical protein